MQGQPALGDGLDHPQYQELWPLNFLHGSEHLCFIQQQFPNETGSPPPGGSLQSPQSVPHILQTGRRPHGTLLSIGDNRSSPFC